MITPTLRRAGLLSAALVAVTVAAPASADSHPPEPRVVVAVIDSPSNPYHSFFNADGDLYDGEEPSSVTPEVLAEFGIGPSQVIELTRTGDFAADFAKDRASFDAIRRGEPYWFKGTNVIGISFSPNDKQRLRPDGTTSAHGVGTTAAVLTANPEAVVVVVESPSGSLVPPGFGTSPLGEQWAFSHPAVDLVSTSYGPPGSPPLGYHLNDSYEGVVTHGKLHFGAADNSPALSSVDATAGPWWSIGVAGYGEGSSEGRTLSSGSYPDVVGDFTQTLPYCRSCQSGTRSVSGTSFATPRAAGTASRALLEARRTVGHLGGITSADGTPVMVSSEALTVSNWQLRRALEEAASYPTTAEYKPGADAPVLDAAPWATTGWGAVTPDPGKGVVRETLAHLGLGAAPTRTKSAAACAFMTGNITARHAYWDLVAPYSQSRLTTSDPYEYC